MGYYGEGEKKVNVVAFSQEADIGDSLEPGSWRPAWVIRQEGSEREMPVLSRIKRAL